MRNQIFRAMLRALCVALIASIVAVGVYAVHLTHIYAAVTITFGTPPVTATAIPAVAMNDIFNHALGKGKNNGK